MASTRETRTQGLIPDLTQPAETTGAARAAKTGASSPPPHAPDAIDARLLRAIAAGDESSIAELHDRYAAILLGLLMRILHSRPEAEDVLQEVFLQVWQQASNFDPARGRPFTWLVTLTRSRALDRLRHLESRDRVRREAANEPSARAGEALDNAMRVEQSEFVQQALERIPEAQRRALILAYFEDLTQSQIAARLGEPLGTIKTRIRAGLMKLHELLRERIGGEK
jgi:RNA polymerase sigma-70 factor (ECF subfamily)